MLALKDHRILIVAPHPDDEVLGCGGLMYQCKKQGGEVYVLFLTVGSTKDFSNDGSNSYTGERMQEIEKVMKFLEVDGYRMAFPGDQYHLQLDKIPQRDLINEIERGKGVSMETVKPTIICSPMVNDYNQDHRAASTALATACRPKPHDLRSTPTMLLQYELAPSTWTTTPDAVGMNLFLDLDNDALNSKIAAMNLYKSQIKHEKSGLSPYGIQTLAQMRGIQSGYEYAEAYFAKRILIKTL